MGQQGVWLCSEALQAGNRGDNRDLGLSWSLSVYASVSLSVAGLIMCPEPVKPKQPLPKH